MAVRRVRLGPEARGALSKIAAVARQPVWLVGGALRDAVLGRSFSDLDLTCADARALAARLARAFKGTLVTLDESNEVYRLVLAPARGRTLKQIDIAGLQGKSILEDLARRDFTLNALALALDANGMPSDPPAAALLDPRGGLKDLAAGLVRADIEENLSEDPLRLLRAFRFAAQLGLNIEPKTLKAIARRKKLVLEPAAERITTELLALLSVPGAASWLRALDEHGLLTSLFPELEPSRRCAVDYYGPGGVLEHTLTVCDRVDLLLTNLRRIYPALASDLEKHLAERGGGVFRALLLLAALLHDVAKPATAKMVDGRLRFFEHDTKGAAATEAILRRLRLSREQIDTASAVVRHHLRPGHLAVGGPLTERAAYRFFRDLGGDAPGLLIVCWGDHASYLPQARLNKILKTATARLPANSPSLPAGPVSAEDKTVAHLRLVSALLKRWRDLSRAPAPERLLDGREVMKALRLPPGPRVGELLERVREAQAEGLVKNRADALALIARLK